MRWPRAAESAVAHEAMALTTINRGTGALLEIEQPSAYSSFAFEL